MGSTILNLFQITAAVDDPVTRTAVLLSLICALMSLSYGCMYIGVAGAGMGAVILELDGTAVLQLQISAYSSPSYKLTSFTYL